MVPRLEDILTEKQIHHILEQTVGKDEVTWVMKRSEVRLPVDGLAGFLGDHMKAVLHVDVQGKEKKIHLFLKRIPVQNEMKATFLNECNFFKREAVMYKLLQEMCDDGPNPWCVKTYICSDSMFVMPDLDAEGYKVKHYLDTLDLEHMLVAVTSLARFHAASVNYETKKSIELNRPYCVTQQFGDILSEVQFYDSPWFRACCKVSIQLLRKFSTKSYHNLLNIDTRLKKLYIEACETMNCIEDTVNVIVHRDLWVNNLMFKYDNGVPINAALIDFQCLRFAPPVFDLVALIYLTTDREFRQEREKDVFDQYYSTFIDNLTIDSKKKVTDLGYDKDNFLYWCEKARMFGMIQAIALFPLILMESKTAQKTFDDPETWEKHFLQDRSEPVVAHAMECEKYKHRNLAVTEEFIETYVLKDL